MEKEYNFDEENTPNLNEPMAEYHRTTEIQFSPPPTEEELRETLTTEQVNEHLHNLINKLYDQ